MCTQEFKSWSDPSKSRVSYGESPATSALAASKARCGTHPHDGAPSLPSGYDFISNKAGSASDCDGHGTHVASTAVGRAVGVAKDANVVAVRILDCSGSGTISNTVAGLDWIARNARLPAVVIMSLGVPTGAWSQVGETGEGAMLCVLICHLSPIPTLILLAPSGIGHVGLKPHQATWDLRDCGFRWVGCGTRLEV